MRRKRLGEDAIFGSDYRFCTVLITEIAQTANLLGNLIGGSRVKQPQEPASIRRVSGRSNAAGKGREGLAGDWARRETWCRRVQGGQELGELPEWDDLRRGAVLALRAAVHQCSRRDVGKVSPDELQSGDPGCVECRAGLGLDHDQARRGRVQQVALEARQGPEE